MLSNVRFMFVLFLFAVSLLGGCAVNPVTGKNELNLVSESQELAIGAKQYMPSRQQQGGDYVTDPQVVAYVKRVGEKLARVADRKLPYEFVVLNNSTPNAWALPGGKIAVNRGLLTELRSEAELAAVLGHEIVHAAARHGAQQLQRGLLMQGVVAIVGATTSSSQYGGLATTAASLGSSLTGRAYGRDAEREADFYGMRYMLRAGYDPYAAVTLQETFVRLSKNRDASWLSGLFASHPPSRERVENNRREARALTAGLKGGKVFVGAKVYRRKMAGLLRDKPAYKAFDKGVAALKKGDARAALALADEALRIQPREALFFSLRGDALRKLERPRKALRAYDRAVELNPDYFAFHVDRGLALRQLGRDAQARKDFTRSIKLLPTATAYYALGRMAADRGDEAAAIKYLRVASTSRSRVGRKAKAELLGLDLEQNPARYIKASLALDRDGYLLVILRNATSEPMRGISFSVGWRQGRGFKPLERSRYARTLKAGRKATISTDIGPLRSRRELHRYHVQIESVDSARRMAL